MSEDGQTYGPLLATRDVTLRISELAGALTRQFVPVPFGTATDISEVAAKVMLNRSMGVNSLSQNIPDRSTMLSLTRNDMWKDNMQKGLSFTCNVHPCSLGSSDHANLRHVMAWADRVSKELGHAMRMRNTENPDDPVLI